MYIQLTLKIMFKSAKDADEDREMFLKSININLKAARLRERSIEVLYWVYFYKVSKHLI